MGAWAAKFGFRGFRRPFCNCEMGIWAAKWAFGLRNGTRVPERCFAAAKIFRRGWAYGCEMISQRGAFGCEMVSQGSSFGCEIFAGQ